MPKFSACVSMMYTEIDFFDRFEAAACSGFRGVELFFPYEYEKDRLSETLERNRLTLVGFCLPAGDWEGGEVGIACLPERVGEFQDGVDRGIEYAKALGCEQIVTIAGIPAEDADEDLLKKTYVSNLKFAATELGKVGVRLMIEPTSTTIRPGTYLQTSAQALSIMEEVNSDNLFLECDVHHMQCMEGDLARNIETNLDRISHIQIADVPDRNEPGTGEINYDYLLPFLDRIGYDRWVGCEYWPRTTTEESLGWIASYMPQEGD